MLLLSTQRVGETVGKAKGWALELHLLLHSQKETTESLCTLSVYLGFTGRRSCFMADRFNGSKVRGAKKKTLGYKLCVFVS